MKRKVTNTTLHLVAEREIELSHMKDSSEKIHIAMEDANFKWTHKQVKDFRYLWRSGMSIVHIADYFKRPQEEVVVLLLDQALRGRVKKRRNGLLGDY